MSLPATPRVLAEAPVVAHVTRNGLVESAHRGSIAVTHPDGTVDWSLGGVDDPFFPRSSNKPLQALAMVRAGLRLEPALLALVCSSHSGEPHHVDEVNRILARAGLIVADLQNTPRYPLDPARHDAAIRDGIGRLAVTADCSGKHAGMLATCVVNGWNLGAYRDPRHPLQVSIAETLADLTGDEITTIGVDGCGAPLMAVTLAGLARAFGRLAAARPGSPEREIADAMRQYPENVGGTGRSVTAVMRGTPGLIAKDGAEAVYAAGLPDGRGLAVKVADGGKRAVAVVLAAVLRRMGVESSAFEELENAPVLGHDEPVGSITAVGI